MGDLPVYTPANTPALHAGQLKPKERLCSSSPVHKPTHPEGNDKTYQTIKKFWFPISPT